MNKLYTTVKVIVKQALSIQAFIRAIFTFSVISRFVKRHPHSYIISLTEHIGDIVACEPVARYLKEKNPGCKVIWIVNRKSLGIIAYNPTIDLKVMVNSLAEWIYLKRYMKRFRFFDLHTDARKCNRYELTLRNDTNKELTINNYYHQGALLEALSQVGGLPKISGAPRLFLPPAKNNWNLPDRYIVVHTSSNEEARNWDHEKWKLLLSYFPSYTFVEVGLAPTLSDAANCVTGLCGKTSVLEAAQIIRHASLFVGIDSAFAHIANALSVPGVVLLGNYRMFKKYMPYTGGYANGENAEVIQYDGKPKDIPVKLVVDKMNVRMWDEVVS